MKRKTASAFIAIVDRVFITMQFKGNHDVFTFSEI